MNKVWAHLRNDKRSYNSGFTLVELLIVIVIIAILAAITIVAYNGITQRANDSQRRSDAESIAKAMQVWSLNNSQPVTNLIHPGWFDYSYSGNPSSKTNLVNARVIPSGVGDPQYQNAVRDYCLGGSDDGTQWAVFVRLQSPSSADTQSYNGYQSSGKWTSAFNSSYCGPASPAATNYMIPFPTTTN